VVVWGRICHFLTSPPFQETALSNPLHRRPTAEECAPHHLKFLEELTEQDVIGALTSTSRALGDLCSHFPGEKSLHRYAPGKWSVRELVGHLTDAERIFGYRMVSIARGSALPLPGFDDQAYVAAAESDRIELPAIVAEFSLLREANLRLVRTVPDAAWDRRTEVNGLAISLRAVAWFAASHLQHHLGVLEERYLKV
jgi:DinB superfamily